MSLRIAFFGQAAFGKDVLDRLVAAGHAIVGAYAPPDAARPDPMAARAAELGIPCFRHKRFRRKGEADPSILAEYLALGAELNVLAFVTAILPPEIVDAPARGSLCFHPSLLPRFRGGAALAWQIIEGEKESGVTVFRPDAGVDTGPIVVQRGGVAILDTHTAGSLYFDALYPLGVDAMAEAVEAVADGSARYRVQDESRATHQGLVDDAVARIDWSRGVEVIDRLVRGCDPQPGAWAQLEGQPLRLFDGRRLDGASDAAPGTLLGIEDGRLVVAAAGGRLGIGRVRRADGGKVPAADAGIPAGARLS
jgi:methionyl-tRNA formyltransferase